MSPVGTTDTARQAETEADGVWTDRRALSLYMHGPGLEDTPETHLGGALLAIISTPGLRARVRRSRIAAGLPICRYV